MNAVMHHFLRLIYSPFFSDTLIITYSNPRLDDFSDLLRLHSRFPINAATPIHSSNPTSQMATTTFSFVTILVCFISLSPFSLLEATANHAPGFTLSLIHRDSPLSPLYNPNHTDFDRLRNAFYRSVSRINNVFKPKAIDISAFQNDLTPNGGNTS
ncbi:unnamed protein product [Dovyalis caffra]|uniref:Uncharacterized protein n=1 Tax=Dovyalis caffra TaxID=77055 RepID=A0AAV1SPJ8_9ROSI|nr:unnamed protein product [Dovyalis caffra]